MCGGVCASSGVACAPSGDTEYSSYVARIHDEEIYHDLCAVKGARELRDPPATSHQPIAFNAVRDVFGFFSFLFFLYSL